VTYSSSGILKVLPALDEQALLNYCESKSASDPSLFSSITVCDNDPTDAGLSCVKMNCALSTGGNGIECSESSTATLVSYGDSAGYIGMSPSDLDTLLAYCDISFN
jgi:hypothetical protein